MSMKHTLTDVAAKVMTTSHRLILKASGGRWLRTTFGMPTVELRTTGRKSGQRRAVMLTTPIHDDNRVVLVASKGGDDRDPDWYRNLVANPEVEITMDGISRQMRARTATPEEKADLWPEVVKAYKGYAGYQQRTARDIPLVLCEPR